MDSSAPAAVPWVVLGVALLALAGLVAVGLRSRRGRSRTPVAPAAPPPERPRSRYPHDDLPGFLEAPPGTPATAPAAAEPPSPAPPPPADDAPGAGRAVAGMAAAALVLVAAVALVAALVGGDHSAAAPPAPSSVPRPTVASTTAAPLPALPGVPSDPLPGESGAGALASRSIPLGADGVTATLGFGGVVVEEHAVGVTVAYPTVSVTAAGDPAEDGVALAHVRFPTWNCLTDTAPADPEAAGCVRSRTEYADLPSPALTVTREGDDVRLTGRFPTYTRPIGTAPAYTGRVYELTVTVSPAAEVRHGRAAAEGTLFLGTDRATTVDAPGVNVVRYGG
ncbi:hypothetical protein ACI789_14920 [Geodermatophilus sp. SYSU D00965]